MKIPEIIKVHPPLQGWTRDLLDDLSIKYRIFFGLPIVTEYYDSKVYNRYATTTLSAVQDLFRLDPGSKYVADYQQSLFSTVVVYCDSIDCFMIAALNDDFAPILELVMRIEERVVE